MENIPESSLSQLLVVMYINIENETSSGSPFMHQQTSCLGIFFKCYIEVNCSYSGSLKICLGYYFEEFYL